MKRIIVTESQYKKLVRQKLNEFIIYNDPADEYDVTPDINTFLRVLDTNLMDKHDQNTYVEKIEKGVVELDEDKYNEEEKETINSIIDYWVGDTYTTADSKVKDLTYNSGLDWEYSDVAIYEPPKEKDEEEDEEEKTIERAKEIMGNVAVDSAYLSPTGIPKNGSETYGLPITTTLTTSKERVKVYKGGEGNNWAGSMGRALWFAKTANDYMGRNIITSQKRPRKTTRISKKISDHWVNNPIAYAVDLGVQGSTADKVLEYIMSLFANGKYSYYKGGYWFDVNIDGYRYQIGWKSDEDHYDHIHVGVKKL